jgi:hypothetical protein
MSFWTEEKDEMKGFAGTSDRYSETQTEQSCKLTLPICINKSNRYSIELQQIWTFVVKKHSLQKDVIIIPYWLKIAEYHTQWISQDEPRWVKRIKAMRKHCRCMKYFTWSTGQFSAYIIRVTTLTPPRSTHRYLIYTR